MGIEVLVCGVIARIICAAICAVIASKKGRNAVGWGVAGFLISLLGVIIVACLPNMQDQAAKDAYIAEENRRLREQLRQERIKGESFRQHATARLDAHDQHLGLDTRSGGPALGAGAQATGQLGAGGADALGEASDDTPRWYYGREGRTLGPVKALEISELIRLQIITRETLIWSDALTDWQPAGQVGTFADSFV